MNCSKCNAQLTEGAKFCLQCGAPVVQAAKNICPACGTENMDVARFCSACGASMTAPMNPVAHSEREPEPQALNEAPVSPVQNNVAEQASVQPPVSAIPTPVNDAAPAVDSAPVNDAASADIPMPVNDATSAAVPVPVNDAAPAQPVVSPADYGAIASDAKNAAEIAATMANLVTPANSSFTPSTENSVGAVDMSGAAALAVKPVKKKKTALWIVLSIVLVLAVAAGVIGLFFRGWFMNLILGDGRYAAQLEAKSILGAVDLVASEDGAASSEDIGQIASDAINDMAKTYRTVNSAEEGDLSSFDINGMIRLYNETLTEAYGTNGAEVRYDIDAELTDAAKSALGVADYAEDIDEVLNAISELSFAMEMAAEEEKMQAYLALAEGSETAFDARVIVQADGTVALTFPFATQKGIVIKLDTGEALEELDVAIDVTKTKDIALELAKIYLAHYSEAEVEIEKGEIEIADITVNGRLVMVDMTDERVGEMVSEMISYISESEYIMSTVLDIINYCGADYTKETLKAELDEAAENVKGSTDVSFKVKTIVDYNSNILGKSYTVTAGEETYGAGYVKGDGEIGAAVFNGERDLLSALIIQENETDGKIHFKVDTGMGALVGMNLDYTGAQIVEFGTSEVVVGDFHVYLAGTKDSKEKGSAFRAGVKYSVEDETYTGSLYIEAVEYGKLAVNTSVTPRDVKISDIPADALDITDVAAWTAENKESLQYLLDLLTDLKESSAFEDGLIAELLAPVADMAKQAIEEKLIEMVPYEEIKALADLLFGAMTDIETAYTAAEEFLTEDIVEDVVDLYSSMSDCYEELADEVEMVKEEFDGYVEQVDDYVEAAGDICETISEIAEEGMSALLPEQEIVATAEDIAKAKADGLIATWSFERAEMYGIEFTAEDMGMTEYLFEIREDGTADCNYLGVHSTAVWTYDGSSLTLIEATALGDVETVFQLTDGALVCDSDGLKMVFLEK